MAQYTDAQREQARDLYVQRGARHASETLHIPLRTIQAWARTERWGTRLAAVSALTPSLGAAQRIGWAARKRGLGDEAGQAAAEALTMFRERVHARKVYGLEPLARSFSLLVERAEQMTAGTGGLEGTATPEESIARVREIVSGLKERAKAAGDA